MLKFRIASDLHTEFMAAQYDNLERIADKLLTPLETDKDTILLLAGDIGSMHKIKVLVKFIDIVAPRFKHVLYIPGNHEYYGGNLMTTVVDIHNQIKHHKNVIFDNMEKLPFQYFGDPRLNNIWMTTLWTDLSGHDADGRIGTMALARGHMNDYKHIGGMQDIYAPTTPEEVLTVHDAMRGVLTAQDGIREGDVVMTHHLPSYLSIDPQYVDHPLNGCYASHLDYLILARKPAVWVHGHTHCSNDYRIGDTRVISNPHGYIHTRDQNAKYNPALTFEV